MRYIWLVCESKPRWSRCVRRFAPGALPSADDTLWVTTAAPPQVRTLSARGIVAGDAAVVLWVLERPTLSATVAALSASVAAGHRALHLAALDEDLSFTGAVGRQARLALCEWQVAGVLDAPEQLPPLLQLIRRHLIAIRPQHPPLDVLSERAPL